MAKKSYCFVGDERIGNVCAARLEAHGWSPAQSAGDAAVVLSYCLTQGALEDLYYGEAGLVQTAAPKSLLIDLSPGTPDLSRELSMMAQVSDLRFVEAPLCVIDPSAEEPFAADNLCVFVAGEDAPIGEAVEILGIIAATVSECEGIGEAQLAKAAFAIQQASQLVSAIEALALVNSTRRGSAFSIEKAKPVGTMSAIGANIVDAVVEKRFSSVYTIEIFLADLVAAMTIADDAEIILPQAEACMHLAELLAVVGGADKSPAALALAYSDEESCTANGLDWSRAEGVFADGDAYGDDFGEDDECGCGHDHGHDHAHVHAHGHHVGPGDFGYSAN